MTETKEKLMYLQTFRVSGEDQDKIRKFKRKHPKVNISLMLRLNLMAIVDSYKDIQPA